MVQRAGARVKPSDLHRQLTGGHIMGTAATHASNPFEMLIDPQAILDAMEASGPLRELNRKICRPLDRQAPVGPKPAEDGAAFGSGVLVDESAPITK
jgi:hypothetical protein